MLMIDDFLETTRRYLFEISDSDAATVQETDMKTMDDRLKGMMARRMRDAVANPPHRVFARELLARGLSANEIWQLVMHDPSFVRVPESFRIAVANAAREMASQPLPAVSRPAGRNNGKPTA